MVDRHKIMDSHGVTHWLRLYRDQGNWYLADDPRQTMEFVPKFEGDVPRYIHAGYVGFNYQEAQTACLNMVGTCSIIAAPGTPGMPVTCFECIAGK